MVLHPATSAENVSSTPTPWQKKIFCQGVVVQEALSVEGAGRKTIFQIWHFFFEIQFKNTLNLIFPSFKIPS